jgi:hypothetical protein
MQRVRIHRGNSLFCDNLHRGAMIRHGTRQRDRLSAVHSAIGLNLEESKTLISAIESEFVSASG